MVDLHYREFAVVLGKGVCTLLEHLLIGIVYPAWIVLSFRIVVYAGGIKSMTYLMSHNAAQCTKILGVVAIGIKHRLLHDSHCDVDTVAWQILSVELSR